MAERLRSRDPRNNSNKCYAIFFEDDTKEKPKNRISPRKKESPKKKSTASEESHKPIAEILASDSKTFDLVTPIKVVSTRRSRNGIGQQTTTLSAKSSSPKKPPNIAGGDAEVQKRSSALSEGIARPSTSLNKRKSRMKPVQYLKREKDLDDTDNSDEKNSANHNYKTDCESNTDLEIVNSEIDHSKESVLEISDCIVGNDINSNGDKVDFTEQKCDINIVGDGIIDSSPSDITVNDNIVTKRITNTPKDETSKDDTSSDQIIAHVSRTSTDDTSPPDGTVTIEVVCSDTEHVASIKSESCESEVESNKRKLLSCEQDTDESSSYESQAKKFKSNKEKDFMFELFQPWALKTYGDLAKTKTITLKKKSRILKALDGREHNNPDSSKFRFWVKSKGFTTKKPENFLNTDAADDDKDTSNMDNIELYVASTIKEFNERAYRKVAVVEDFFNIIYNVHVELGGRGGRHAGQKRTYRIITETYAFLPREAVTKFLSACPVCKKNLRPFSPSRFEDQFTESSSEFEALNYSSHNESSIDSTQVEINKSKSLKIIKQQIQQETENTSEAVVSSSSALPDTIDSRLVEKSEIHIKPALNVSAEHFRNMPQYLADIQNSKSNNNNKDNQYSAAHFNDIYMKFNRNNGTFKMPSDNSNIVNYYQLLAQFCSEKSISDIQMASPPLVDTTITSTTPHRVTTQISSHPASYKDSTKQMLADIKKSSVMDFKKAFLEGQMDNKKQTEYKTTAKAYGSGSGSGSGSPRSFVCRDTLPRSEIPSPLLSSSIDLQITKVQKNSDGTSFCTHSQTQSNKFPHSININIENNGVDVSSTAEVLDFSRKNNELDVFIKSVDVSINMSNSADQLKISCKTTPPKKRYNICKTAEETMVNPVEKLSNITKTTDNILNLSSGNKRTVNNCTLNSPSPSAFNMRKKFCDNLRAPPPMMPPITDSQKNTILSSGNNLVLSTNNSPSALHSNGHSSCSSGGSGLQVDLRKVKPITSTYLKLTRSMGLSDEDALRIDDLETVPTSTPDTTPDPNPEDAYAGLMKDADKLKLMLLAWNYQNSNAVRNGSEGPDLSVVGGLWAQYQNALALTAKQSSVSPINRADQSSPIENQDETNSSGQKDEDDGSEDDSDDKLDQNAQDPERLKAFNMFVRLFVDENLDRMIPISKQPKEKIQAIIDSCARQFPEFCERSRKRIRTYLKSCRRNKKAKEGWDNSSRPTPAHLTSVQAEQILAIACENESMNAKRMRIGLDPISQAMPLPNSTNVTTETIAPSISYPGFRTTPTTNSTGNDGEGNATSTTVPTVTPARSSPLGLNVNTNENKPAIIANGSISASQVSSPIYRPADFASPSSTSSPYQARAQTYSTFFQNSLSGNAAPTDLSMKQQQQQQQPQTQSILTQQQPPLQPQQQQQQPQQQLGMSGAGPNVGTASGRPPLLSHKLNQNEMNAVRQLITGYRESAAFLLRSADELEQLLLQQQ